MHSRHLTTTRQTLHRIFISPFLARPNVTASPTQLPRTLYKLPSRPYSITSRRCQPSATNGPRPFRPNTPAGVARTSPLAAVLEDPARPINERIGQPSTQVHLVDSASDTLQPPSRLSTLLAGIDPKTEVLRQVARNEAGVPVVKVVTLAALKEEAARRAEAARGRPPRVEREGKQIELNWGIDEHDLEHRLRRLEEFLGEGRRVEVLVAQKRGGRRTGVEEREELVETVRERVKGVAGGAEWKEMAGEVGRQVNLFFEVRGGAGAQAKKENRKGGMVERMARKEAKKAEEREKNERRWAKKRESEERLKELDGQNVG